VILHKGRSHAVEEVLWRHSVEGDQAPVGDLARES
jgi:hypothetical protein